MSDKRGTLQVVAPLANEQPDHDAGNGHAPFPGTDAFNVNQSPADGDDATSKAGIGSSAAQRPIPDGAVEIDFAHLADGTIVEMVEDPTDSSRTVFAAWNDGEVRYADRLETDRGAIVPLPRTGILKQVRLPCALSPYGSVQTVLARIEKLISRCVDLEPTYVSILANFVLSTWFVDRFEVAPYLSVVGLPQCGKTTLLRTLSLVCRRSLLVTDITPASFYRVCTHFMPTVLIDEAGSIRGQRTLRHILRAGTTYELGSVQGNQSFHAYGAKVISWLEPPDDAALNSRCILIPMSETTKTDLINPSDPEMEREGATLQAQLLQFRFENYKRVTMKPDAVPEHTPVFGSSLRPRVYDLMCALIATHPQDVERCKRVLEFFESGQAVPQEPLDSDQNAVLHALVSMVQLGDNSTVSLRVGDLTSAVNCFLELRGEKLRLLPRKVGAIMASLGFCNRRRTSSGWDVIINGADALKCHRLAQCYGIDAFRVKSLFTSRDDRVAESNEPNILDRKWITRSTDFDFRSKLQRFVEDRPL